MKRLMIGDSLKGAIPLVEANWMARRAPIHHFDKEVEKIVGRCDSALGKTLSNTLHHLIRDHMPVRETGLLRNLRTLASLLKSEGKHQNAAARQYADRLREDYLTNPERYANPVDVAQHLATDGRPSPDAASGLPDEAESRELCNRFESVNALPGGLLARILAGVTLLRRNRTLPKDVFSPAEIPLILTAFARGRLDAAKKSITRAAEKAFVEQYYSIGDVLISEGGHVRPLNTTDRHKMISAITDRGDEPEESAPGGSDLESSRLWNLTECLVLLELAEFDRRGEARRCALDLVDDIRSFPWKYEIPDGAEVPEGFSAPEFSNEDDGVFNTNENPDRVLSEHDVEFLRPFGEVGRRLWHSVLSADAGGADKPDIGHWRWTHLRDVLLAYGDLVECARAVKELMVLVANAHAGVGDRIEIPPEDDHKAKERSVTDDGTALWRRGMTPEEKHRVWDVGMPLPYAGYSKDHHPTNFMHVALWFLSYLEGDDETGTGKRYTGPSVHRGRELDRVNGIFLDLYFRRMQAQRWANEDGSPITDALGHILDAFREWREEELAKAPENRACEFGEDGYPVSQGSYYPYSDYAWDCYAFDCRDPNFNLNLTVDYWVRFAVRDLVPSGWKEPIYWHAHPDELYWQKTCWYPIPGLENDEQLLPEGFADYARARLKAEGEDDPWGNRRS